MYTYLNIANFPLLYSFRGLTIDPILINVIFLFLFLILLYKFFRFLNKQLLNFGDILLLFSPTLLYAMLPPMPKGRCSVRSRFSYFPSFSSFILFHYYHLLHFRKWLLFSGLECTPEFLETSW